MNGESTTYTYDGEDKILTQTTENGTGTEFAYNDDRGWPTNITHKDGGTPFAEYDLTYDGRSDTVGNLTRVDDGVGDYVVYTYNDLHRLLTETRTGTGTGSFATYDSGNKIDSTPSGSITNVFANDPSGRVTPERKSPCICG